MLNKVTLIGNLGADPEVRYMQNGKAIARISVATTRRWKDKATGQRKDATEWHRVVMFNRLGEVAGEYLKKGSKVYIEGRIQTNKWQDKEGNDRYTTEIIASEMQMLGSRSDNRSDDRSDELEFAPAPAPTSSPAPAPTSSPAPAPTSSSATAPTSSSEDFYDDDVPF